MPFRLQKWYMDCAAHNGEALIAYRAKLSWNGFAQDYSAILSSTPDGAVSEYTTLRKSNEPIVSKQRCVWTAHPLKLSGSWEVLENGFTNSFGSDGSRLTWTCVAPRANATVKHRHKKLEGTGYVEHIDLQVPPEKLGIKELHWGRFIGSETSVIWIAGSGAKPFKAIYVNGELNHEGTIADDRITIGRNALSLTKQTILREGPLIHSAFAKLPVLKEKLKGLSLNIDEYKVLSRGRFSANGIVDSGWAIHEIVRWI